MLNINHIANLARIYLSKDEKEIFNKEFPAILAYFEKMKEADTSGVNDSSTINNLINVLRKDEPRKENIDQTIEKIIKLAPDLKERFLKIKKILY